MMKLTTPATASAPYTADAPPVSTSTRSINAAGIWFKSGDAAAFCVGSPGIRRRLFTSTSVRCEPRLRRLTLAVPVEPFERLPPKSAKACGRLLIRSSTRVTPSILTCSAPTAVTGLTLVRLGCGMREPVTTTSWMVEPSCACAGSAPASAAAALVSSTQRTARRSELFVDIDLPPRRFYRTQEMLVAVSTWDTTLVVILEDVECCD
jgi:hypothetical protein